MIQLRFAWEGKNQKGEICDKCVTLNCHGREMKREDMFFCLE